MDVDIFIQIMIVRFLHHSIAIGKLSFTFTKRNLIRVSIVKIVCQLEIHMKIGCSILRFFSVFAGELGVDCFEGDRKHIKVSWLLQNYKRNMSKKVQFFVWQKAFFSALPRNDNSVRSIGESFSSIFYGRLLQIVDLFLKRYFWIQDTWWANQLILSFSQVQHSHSRRNYNDIYSWKDFQNNKK